MSPHLTINAIMAGRKTPLVPDFEIPVPPEAVDGSEPQTLRSIISRIVINEVEKFRTRQQKRRLMSILSPKQIREGLDRGRVDMGGRELYQTVDEEEAIGTALQGFEDGLYLVFIDGEEKKDLDQQIYLRQDSHCTFIRLVMLAGA
jgi:hypothetical protein